MNNVTVRTPTHDEFLEIAQFSFENFVTETAKSTGQPVEIFRNKVGGPPTMIGTNDIWFLIEKEGARVGFIWIKLMADQESAFGYDIYLDPSARSQGIGRHVMNACGEKLKALGVKTVDICVFEHNEIARKLYDSLGFRTKKFDEERRQFTLTLKLH